jgi:hypothetical protein
MKRISSLFVLAIAIMLINACQTTEVQSSGSSNLDINKAFNQKINTLHKQCLSYPWKSQVTSSGEDKKFCKCLISGYEDKFTDHGKELVLRDKLKFIEAAVQSTVEAEEAILDLKYMGLSIYIDWQSDYIHRLRAPPFNLNGSNPTLEAIVKVTEPVFRQCIP